MSRDTVVPLTVHTVGVVEVNVTVRPEEAVALITPGDLVGVKAIDVTGAGRPDLVYNEAGALRVLPNATVIP